jgi:hypothetical protein
MIKPHLLGLLSEAARIFEKSPTFLELKSRVEKLEEQNNKNNK